MDSSMDLDAGVSAPPTATMSLPPTRQRRLAHDLAKIVAFVGTPPPGGPEAEAIEHVDFPHFVAALIEGLLKAMANGEDASDHQMRAYAHLVEAVRRSVDEFEASQAQGSEDERPHRDYLTSKYPEFVGGKPITPATKRALVADILLMGIERVVVGPGAAGVKAKVAVKAKAKKPARKAVKAAAKKKVVKAAARGAKKAAKAVKTAKTAKAVKGTGRGKKPARR
jgi:hypothetical protein